MRTRSISLCLFVAIITSSSLPLRASAASADPSALVTELGAQAEQILGDTSLTSTERHQRFRALLDQDFDFPTISRFVLGRYWQGSSDSLRREFSGLFEDYVIQSLNPEFALYDGESIAITSTHAEGDRTTIVSTTITRPNGVAQSIVDWRVQNTPTGYKIADVNVSGVSMATTYREQFAAVIDRGGGQVAVLIPALRQKLDDQAHDPGIVGAQAKGGRP